MTESGVNSQKICALCSHVITLDTCGHASVDPNTHLCHADSHSCYHRWTVSKERPTGQELTTGELDVEALREQLFSRDPKLSTMAEERRLRTLGRLLSKAVRQRDDRIAELEQRNDDYHEKYSL